jgi:hypothetical protein
MRSRHPSIDAHPLGGGRRQGAKEAAQIGPDEWIGIFVADLLPGLSIWISV